jgi:hypothetical protein
VEIVVKHHCSPLCFDNVFVASPYFRRAGEIIIQ